MSSFFNCVFFIDKSRGLFSFISDHRSDVVGFQFVAAVKPGEFQKKYNFFHDSAKFFYQFSASFHRTAGSNQVIYDNDFLTFGNGIFVKFDLGGAVLAHNLHRRFHKAVCLFYDMEQSLFRGHTQSQNQR